jgi:hypothetical protein
VQDDFWPFASRARRGADRCCDAAWDAQDLDVIASMHDDAIVFHNHRAGRASRARRRRASTSARSSPAGRPSVSCAARCAAATTSRPVSGPRVPCTPTTGPQVEWAAWTSSPSRRGTHRAQDVSRDPPRRGSSSSAREHGRTRLRCRGSRKLPRGPRCQLVPAAAACRRSARGLPDLAQSSSAPPHRAERSSSSDAIAERAHRGLLRMPACGRAVPMSPVPGPVVSTLITQQKGTATIKLTTQTTSLSMALCTRKTAARRTRTAGTDSSPGGPGGGRPRDPGVHHPGLPARRGVPG